MAQLDSSPLGSTDLGRERENRGDGGHQSLRIDGGEIPGDGGHQ